MEIFSLQHFHIKKATYEGIYVFLANSKYIKSDFALRKNCTAPVVWVIVHERIEAQLRVCSDIDVVCAFEFVNFKELAKPRVEELLLTFSPSKVQEMIDKIESFIKDTIKAKYD